VVTKRQISEYIRNERLPIVPAQDISATDKFVEEAIRWYDEEGATIVAEQFNIGSGVVITLPDRVDTVFDVTPDRVVSEIFTAQTLLLGVTILDYDIITLAMKQEHLANLRTFLASRMRWRWIKPYLHFDGALTAVTSVVVKYLRHYDWTNDEDDITDKGLNWIIRYARGLFKKEEGRILRMGSAINMPLDGPQLASEGVDEIKEVKQELIDKRAIIPISRSW
jgi:hypothetical protein